MTTHYPTVRWRQIGYERHKPHRKISCQLNLFPSSGWGYRWFSVALARRLPVNSSASGFRVPDPSTPLHDNLGATLTSALRPQVTFSFRPPSLKMQLLREISNRRGDEPGSFI